MMLSLCRALNFKYVCNRVPTYLMNHECKLYSRAYYTYTEDGLNRMMIDHNETDDESLFQNAHSVVKQSLTNEKITFHSLVSRRNEQVLDYVNVGGRLRRFRIFMHTYRTLAPEKMGHNHHLLQASVMGYLTEMLTSTTIVIDDILDNSDLRRNKLPWYKIAGRQTALDISLLYSGIFIVMKDFFQKEPYYVPCFELLNEVGWIISTVGSLDCMTPDIFTRQKEHFNMETYRTLCFGKMTSNAFYMPIITAMYMANHDFSEYSDKLLKIIDEMGFYSLIENDYCDRYGKTTGKVLDDDIKTGKITWLLLTAMELANDNQKEIISQYYGKEDRDSVNAVVNIYNQLKLDEITTLRKKEMYDAINREIQTIPDPRVCNILMYANRLIIDWYADK